MPIPNAPRGNLPTQRPQRQNNDDNGNVEDALPLPLPDTSTTSRIHNEYDEDDDTFTPINNTGSSMYDDDDEDEDSLLPPRPVKSSIPDNVKPARKRPTRTYQPENDIDYDSDDDEDEDSINEEDNDSELSDQDKFYANLEKKDKEAVKAEVEEAEEKSKKPKKSLLKKDVSKGSKRSEIKPGYTEDTFIDTEKKTLKPFGRTKRKAKVGEFDGRKNKAQKALMVQIGVIALLICLILLGLYRTLFPPKQLTTDDVNSLIAVQLNDTGFPTDRGAAFATNFMSAYLNINNDAANTNTTQKILSYYYNGDFAGTTVNLNRSVSSNFKQKLLSAPVVYQKNAISNNSASYTIGALVSPTATSDGTNNDTSSDNSDDTSKVSDVKWAFFNVNVFYRKSTDSFIITPESPSVVPAETIETGTIPEMKELGDGQSDNALADKIKSVVIGYVKGYAVSSLADHSAVDQYINDNTNVSLIKGLNGTYDIEGDDNSSIQLKAYHTDTPGTVKAEVTVQWTDTSTATDRSTYKSTYAMTLIQQSNGKYLVSKFAPEVYVPAPAN